MRSILWLTTLASLLFVASCSNIRVSGNKVAERVDVSVGGAHITVNNTEVERLEKDNAELLRQLEAVKSQLAARETLLAEQVKDLQSQMTTLLEKIQALTERLAALRQNDAGLQRQLKQIGAELARERAARAQAESRAAEAEAADKAADEGTEPEAEDEVWAVSVLENQTRCAVNFRVLGDEGKWESFTLQPGEQRTFKRMGETIQIMLRSRQWSVDSSTFSHEPAGAELSHAPISYFDYDEEGDLNLFGEED